MVVKTEIPKILIDAEGANDIIYSINTYSILNQEMLKLMKSEVLMKECEERISTKREYIDSFKGVFYTESELESEIRSLYKVWSRIKNYRYKKMITVSDLIGEALPIDYKF